MTLDATKPTDEELVSVLPSYIRANRAAINILEAAGFGDVVTVTDLAIATGLTSLIVGTHLSAAEIEIVKARAVTTNIINQITKGTNGQIKIFVFQNSSVTFVDGVKNTGYLYLNQLPIGSSFSAAIDDVLALVNIGGDGSSEYGYWKEIWRMISVK